MSWENKYNEAIATKEKIFDKQSFATDGAKLFRKIFNKHCRWAFVFCLTEYQDYSQPILLPHDWLAFQSIAKILFEPQWRFLASLRNINKNKDSPDLLAYKERQVFCQLLAL